MKHLRWIPGIVLAALSLSTTAQTRTTEEAQYMEWARGVWEKLDRRQGEIPLPNGVATLEVPEAFYYLGPEDTRTVLVEVWGNPPGSADSLQGMLFPSATTPFEPESWAVTIDYEEDGHVADEDADELDYDALLEQMKADTREASAERVRQGFEPMELVGWASPPYYDAAAHKLHWAKELSFGGSADHTLNYNIRVLGRKGVLVLNFIAGMEQKPVIDERLDAVLAIADFSDGMRYADFDPDLDEVAAYGIGALVAGKVLAKTGFLAIALVFLKKFGVYIVVAAGLVAARLFRRKSGSEA